VKRIKPKTEILNAKCAKDLRKERKVLVLNNLFFANFAKNLCALCVKKTFDTASLRVIGFISFIGFIRVSPVSY